MTRRRSDLVPSASFCEENAVDKGRSISVVRILSISGEERVLSTALNEYVDPNLGMMLNRIYILGTDVASTASIAPLNDESKGMNVFTLGAQLNF